MSNSIQRSILFFLFLSVASCAGPGPRPLVSTITEETSGDVPFQWAQYEDFDLTPYREDPIDHSAITLHDVPELLRSANTPSPQSRNSSDQVSGYRIQIISTLDKQEADRTVEDALAWWKGFVQDPDLMELYPRTEEQPPVYQDFRVPYHRVRIGNFISREEAQSILDVIERDYARAFIAPDLVIIQ